MYNIYLTDEGVIAVPSWINSFIVKKNYPEAKELKKKVQKFELEKGTKIIKDFAL